MSSRRTDSQVKAALEQRVAQLSLINKVASGIVASLQLSEVLERAARLVQASFGYHHVGLFTLDEDGTALVLRARAGDFAALFPSEHRLKLGQGMVGWVGCHGRTRLANDVLAEPHYVNLYPDVIPTRSELSVPIQMGDKLLGVLDVQSPRRDAFDENDAMVIETIADQVAVAIDNARLYEAVQRELDHRKRVELALKERQLYLEGVLAAAPDAIVTLDAQHRVVEWNPGAVKLFGYSREEALGQDLDHLIAKDQVFDQAFGFTKTALTGEPVGPIESVRYRRDGTPMDVILAGSPILIGDEPIGLVAVYTDITERKQTEEALSRRAAELQALALVSAALRAAQSVDEILPLVLEQATVVLGAAMGTIFLIEPETGDLVSCASYPPGFYPLGLRHPYGEGITGHVAASGEVYVSEDLASDPLARILPEEVAHMSVMRSQVSLPLRTKERNIGVIHLGWHERLAFTPEEVRLLSASADIAANALHRALVVEGLEAEVAARTAEIRAEKEQIERTLRRFITNVSHQLRTPLTSLQLYVHLLQQECQTEPAESYLKRLEDQTSRLIHLTEDILEMTALDSGQGVTVSEPVSLPIVVEVAVTRYQGRAATKGLTLETKPVPPDLPLVKGDEARLIQALAELVENAVIFTPIGGQVTIEVETVEDKGEEWVTVAVHDSGPGISLQEQALILNPFFRGSLAESGHIPGTGLGLSIAHEIVRAHGGRLLVESPTAAFKTSGAGQGSTFVIWLPLAE